MDRLRVLIADDNEEARRLIVRLLSPKFEIVGSVSNGKQLVDAATAVRPDVIVSDISMPLLTGPRAMRELKTMGLDIPFVLLAANSVDMEKQLREGATVFVDKIDMGYDLVCAVRAASSRQIYFSRSVSCSIC